MGLDTYIYKAKKTNAYLRKCNAVIGYFKKEFDDELINAWVNKEMINQFLQDIDKVLADHSLAKELIPTQSGFFFGSTDYDDYYFEKLERIKETFSSLVKDLTDYDWIIIHNSY